jgi:hypothetical protein
LKDGRYAKLINLFFTRDEFGAGGTISSEQGIRMRIWVEDGEDLPRHLKDGEPIPEHGVEITDDPKERFICQL